MIQTPVMRRVTDRWIKRCSISDDAVFRHPEREAPTHEPVNLILLGSTTKHALAVVRLSERRVVDPGERATRNDSAAVRVRE